MSCLCIYVILNRAHICVRTLNAGNILILSLNASHLVVTVVGVAE